MHPPIRKMVVNIPADGHQGNSGVGIWVGLNTTGMNTHITAVAINHTAAYRCTNGTKADITHRAAIAARAAVKRAPSCHGQWSLLLSLLWGYLCYSCMMPKHSITFLLAVDMCTSWHQDTAAYAACMLHNVLLARPMMDPNPAMSPLPPMAAYRPQWQPVAQPKARPRLEPTMVSRRVSTTHRGLPSTPVRP